MPVTLQRTVLEVAAHDTLPLFENPEWGERFSWLVQGVTARGESGEPFDLRLFGPAPSGPVQGRWDALRAATEAVTVAHARQVHGSRVILHADAPEGLLIAPAADGHATRTPGVLLTVALADCVPVFVIHPESRAVALLHAGWRGLAAGVLERGLDLLGSQLAAPAGGAHVHLGPAVCGDCYEVGPEVHEALGLEAPAGPEPVDLRRVLAARAAELGVPENRITTSGHCTRCGDSPFLSHRGGDSGRQVAFLGLRA